MSDRDAGLADGDSAAAEYAELVQLIVDGAWNPGDIVCTSQGVTWQFRAVPYTSDFPDYVEDPRRRGVKGQAISRLLTLRSSARHHPP